MLLYFVHKPNFTIHTKQQINRKSSGQAIYQAANLQPVTAQGRVIFRVIPRGIYGWQTKSETGFALSTSASSYHYHPTIAP